MFSEEVDWMTRFRRAGWKVLFFPGAEVVHVGGASHGGRMYVENLRGHLRWFAKHRGAEGGRARAAPAALVAAPARACVLRREGVSRGRSLPLVRQCRALADQVIEYLRLAFGTALVLLPGAAVARALGQRSVSASSRGRSARVFVAWAVVFTVHSNIRLAVLVLAVISRRCASSSTASNAANLVRDTRTRFAEVARARVGVVLGWFLWRVAGVVVGDGLFHEARVRKLVELGDLHLRTVDEFKDGGLHPGYAFPLWHGFVALVAWFSGLDPDVVVRHEPSLLAPIACAVAWEAGVAVFGSRARRASRSWSRRSRSSASARATAARTRCSRCPATAARQLLVPAAIALFFTARTGAGRATLAAIFGAIALSIRPTRSSC